MDPNVIAYLISLSASMSWDAVKALFSQKTESNEKLLIDAITSTMQFFYDYKGFEYNEEIVMERFLNSARMWKNLKWDLRNVIEDIVDTKLTDAEFKLWVEEFEKKYPFSEHPFTDRDRIQQRIKYKLEDTVVHNHGPFYDYVDRTITAFNSSWKQEYIDLFKKNNVDCSFAEEPENYDSIREFFLDAAKRIELDRLTKEEKQLINKTILNPHYNKVQFIIGTSGAGKTHFVQMYSETVRKKLLEGEKAAAPCKVELSTTNSFYNDIFGALRRFLEVDYYSLTEYSNMLNAIGIDICFVVENIDTILNNDWDIIARIIENISRFEQFKFIVTINEYEYFQIASNSSFIERYGIENLQFTIFKNCLSIDEINRAKDIVGEILSIDYNADTQFKTELYTPQEAIYYGECIKDEKNASPPSSYFEYIEKIVRWKQEQVGTVCLDDILDSIVSQRNSLIKTRADVTSLRKAQLLTVDTHSSIFSSSPQYHLRIYPYWAAKIVGYDSNGILDYSDDLKEYLVPCYIFQRYGRGADGADNVQSFITDLYDNGLLDYALFCAHKADKSFGRALKDFILGVKVDTPRLCYSILRFVDYSSLKVSEKFEIFSHIADAVKEYGLVSLYDRTLIRILHGMSKTDSIRRNMRVFVYCDNEDINLINGYRIGQRYMELIGNPSIFDLTIIIVQYIQQNHMEKSIDAEWGNRSFLDYFLRKCFEHYIGHHKMVLQRTYDELKLICNYNPPIGPFVKRNLTCAAGNIFEKKESTQYQDEYIDVAKKFANKPDIQEKLTAWYLISNSLDLDDKYSDKRLNPQLNKLIVAMMDDQEVMDYVGDEIKEFLSKVITDE